MKAPDWQDCTEKELWKYVAWHLARAGIDSVLVGGSVVAIYSQGAYQSGDLDFIIEHDARQRAAGVLKQIGFSQEGRHFRHPDCRHLFVEFPPGPLAIGSNYRIIPAVESLDGQELKILSPADCICDRLASYIHFKSRDALDQAVLVARNQPFNRSKVQQWCAQENASEAYAEFVRLTKGSDKE